MYNNIHVQYNNLLLKYICIQYIAQKHYSNNYIKTTKLYYYICKCNVCKNSTFGLVSI